MFNSDYFLYAKKRPYKPSKLLIRKKVLTGIVVKWAFHLIKGSWTHVLKSILKKRNISQERWINSVPCKLMSKAGRNGLSLARVLENQERWVGFNLTLPPSKSNVWSPNMTNNTSLESSNALPWESPKKLQIFKNS